MESILSAVHDSTHYPTGDESYATINVLHAVRWPVEAWKVGVKHPTFEHCYSGSQVKIHGPALQEPPEVDDSEDPGSEIFDSSNASKFSNTSYGSSICCSGG